MLGCTSPTLPIDKKNVMIFLCDGRFHMEATMISNPEFKFYQYDPYSKKFTIDEYQTKKMMANR